MVRSASRPSRWRRHPRQQRRHPARRDARRVPGRSLGRRGRDQPDGRVSHHAARAPAHARRDWGRILNIASVHGLVASVGKAAYVAAKHGLLGSPKSPRSRPRAPITCNASVPGLGAHAARARRRSTTRAADEGVSFEVAKAALLGDKQPSLEFVHTVELGALAVFLCCDARVAGAWCSVEHRRRLVRAVAVVRRSRWFSRSLAPPSGRAGRPRLPAASAEHAVVADPGLQVMASLCGGSRCTGRGRRRSGRRRRCRRARPRS